jgi:hypothetical protein
MIRSAIIILLVNYCAFLFSQQITSSRNFETRKKNVPLAIINKHPKYFHVLRYNKEVHDITVERRAKPSAEIIAFTPLKLDSVNAHWFNYESLDYIFFESNSKIYFLFEKVLNFKREIFLKVVDTTGKSTGFIELAALDKEKNIDDFRFEFKLTAQNKILILATQDYFNGTSKKVAQLYDPEKLEKIWVKKLPIENQATGFSMGYECNEENDLFYVRVNAEIISFSRKYENHSQVEVPVFFYNSVTMISFLNDAPSPVEKEIAVDKMLGLNGISLFPSANDVSLWVHFSKTGDTGEEKVFFLSQKWSKDLATDKYARITPLSSRLEEQLTFYDGSDFKSAADKKYFLLDKMNCNNSCYILSERREENFYKELILVKVDLSTGEILKQEIIPRKIFYYDDRTRFRSMGETIRILSDTNFYSILLESRANIQKEAADFRYHKFSKQGASGGNVVSYILRANGNLEKKIFYKNDGYDFIPLPYQSDQPDFIFYLNRTRFEKFAILKLNPF